MGIGDFIQKAKEAATDERIDQAAEQIKKVAPDNIDRHVDSAAEQAKKHNEDGPDAAERAQRAAAGPGLGEAGTTSAALRDDVRREPGQR